MDLQAKRTLLVAQREQLMANLNATSGAIALCEELIAEEQKEAAALLKAAEHEAYMDKMAPPLEAPEMPARPYHLFPRDFENGGAPPTAPEMLPVVYDEDEAPAVERDLPIGASA